MLRNDLAGVFSQLSYMNIYSGAIPATGDTAATGTLLVSWSGTLAWGGPASGVTALTGTPITSNTAVATGTAGYAEIYDSSTTIMYCTVGTSGAEVNLSSLSIVTGGTVNLTSGSITIPAT